MRTNPLKHERSNHDGSAPGGSTHAGSKTHSLIVDSPVIGAGADRQILGDLPEDPCAKRQQADILRNIQ
jgi:hypothetical protein